MTDVELANQCKAIYAGVAWPGKQPGFAVVVAMTPEEHFDGHDTYLLAEYESFDMRELVRQCGVLDAQYEPMTWYGDEFNENAERPLDLAPTDSMGVQPLYPYLLGTLKKLLRDHRLFLKGSRIAGYLSQIEPGEIAECSAFAFWKTPFLPRKPRKVLANLARGYHRPGGCRFAKKDAAKALAVSVGTRDFP